MSSHNILQAYLEQKTPIHIRYAFTGTHLSCLTDVIYLVSCHYICQPLGS